MRTHIDWITFTLSPVWVSDIPAGGFEQAYHNALMDGFILQFGATTCEIAFAGAWKKQGKSRAPYVDCWRLGDAGVTVFASPALKHFCVEVSGAGCETLIRKKVLQSVLSMIVDRVTRIDIATDIETPVTPSQFVETLSHKRMRASGYQISATGETQYVGSQKSDRYARVYRYNSPHPRSHLLRIEHVFRRAYAKVVAREIIAAEVESVASAAGRAFGWEHPIWKPETAHNVGVSVSCASKRAQSTLFWMVHTVAPSFKKLVESGEINDAEAFLMRHFLPEERTHA